MTDAEFDSDDMIAVTKRLIQILKAEIELIKEMKLGELHQFNDEKNKLISIMEHFRSVLKNNPNIVKSLPEQTLTEMREVTKEFEVLIKEDGKQLLKARKVHSLIMDAIKKVVDDIGKQSAGYNKFGVLDQGKKKMLYIVPVSISESF